MVAVGAECTEVSTKGKYTVVFSTDDDQSWEVTFSMAEFSRWYKARVLADRTVNKKEVSSCPTFRTLLPKNQEAKAKRLKKLSKLFNKVVGAYPKLKAVQDFCKFPGRIKKDIDQGGDGGGHSRKASNLQATGRSRTSSRRPSALDKSNSRRASLRSKSAGPNKKERKPAGADPIELEAVQAELLAVQESYQELQTTSQENEKAWAAQKAELEGKNVDLVEQLNTAKAETEAQVADLQKQLSNDEGRMGEWLEKYSKSTKILQDENLLLKKKLRMVEDEAREMQSQLEANVKDLTEQHDTLVQSNEDAAANDNRDDAIKTLTAQKDDAVKQLQKAKSEIKRAGEYVQKLKKKDKDLRAERDAAQEKVEDMEDECRRLRVAADMRGNMSGSDDPLVKYQDEIVDLKKQLNEMEKLVPNSKKPKAAQAADVDNDDLLKSMVGSLIGDMEDQQNEDSEIWRLQQELNQIRGEGELVKMRHEKELEDKDLELEQKVHDVQNQLRDKDEEMDQLNATLERRDMTIMDNDEKHAQLLEELEDAKGFERKLKRVQSNFDQFKEAHGDAKMDRVLEAHEREMEELRSKYEKEARELQNKIVELLDQVEDDSQLKKNKKLVKELEELQEQLEEQRDEHVRSTKKLKKDLSSHRNAHDKLMDQHDKISKEFKEHKRSRTQLEAMLNQQQMQNQMQRAQMGHSRTGSMMMGGAMMGHSRTGSMMGGMGANPIMGHSRTGSMMGGGMGNMMGHSRTGSTMMGGGGLQSPTPGHGHMRAGSVHMPMNGGYPNAPQAPPHGGAHSRRISHSAMPPLQPEPKQQSRSRADTMENEQLLNHLQEAVQSKRVLVRNVAAEMENLRNIIRHLVLIITGQSSKLQDRFTSNGYAPPPLPNHGFAKPRGNSTARNVVNGMSNVGRRMSQIGMAAAKALGMGGQGQDHPPPNRGHQSRNTIFSDPSNGTSRPKHGRMLSHREEMLINQEQMDEELYGDLKFNDEDFNLSEEGTRAFSDDDGLAFRDDFGADDVASEFAPL